MCLLQEHHTAVRQRRFTGPDDSRSPARHRGWRDGVMRCPQRRAHRQRGTSAEQPGDRMDRRDLGRVGSREVRQDSGQAPGQRRCGGTVAGHAQVVATGCAGVQRQPPLGADGWERRRDG